MPSSVAPSSTTSRCPSPVTGCASPTASNAAAASSCSVDVPVPTPLNCPVGDTDAAAQRDEVERLLYNLLPDAPPSPVASAAPDLPDLPPCLPASAHATARQKVGALLTATARHVPDLRPLMGLAQVIALRQAYEQALAKCLAGPDAATGAAPLVGAAMVLSKLVSNLNGADVWMPAPAEVATVGANRNQVGAYAQIDRAEELVDALVAHAADAAPQCPCSQAADRAALRARLAPIQLCLLQVRRELQLGLRRPEDVAQAVSASRCQAHEIHATYVPRR